MHSLRTPADPRTALLDRMSTFVLTVDAAGNITYANAAAVRALGADEDSPVGLPISLIAPELVGASWSAFLATMRAGGVITRDTRLRGLDGSDLTAEVTAELLGFGDSELCALFARTRRSTAVPSAQQQFFQFAIEHHPDGVYCIDRHGKITYVNQAACALLGYSRSELESMRVFDVNPALDPDRWDQLWDALLEERSRKIQSAHLAKDGRMIPLEVSSSLFEIDGKQFSCAFVRDITEQRAGDEARQREHGLIESLIDTAPVMVLMLDADGCIVRFNACTERSTGYRLEEVRGRSWVDLMVAEEDRGEVSRLLRESLAGASLKGAVYRLRTSAGALREVVWYGQLLADPASGSVGLLAVGQDLTEQRDLEQRLRQAEKMEAIGRLAGGIAHDFNNQLTAIMGWTDVLGREVEGRPELLECTDRIMVAVRRACDLTSQLLAYSRKGKYVTKAVDLHELVHEVVAILRRSLDKRIEIRLDLGAETPFTPGDPTQLGNAMLNLALNARDAMPDGGTLRFATRLTAMGEDRLAAAGTPEPETGTFVELTVSDTGTGMDAKTQRHMFEPFFTTKEEGRGTGLGLAAVYGTVKNHRGTIGITSALGRGTTVRICLPITRPNVREAFVPRPTTILPTESPRVLLVDDEDLVRDILTRFLHHLGCQVTSFKNGFDAVDHYRVNAASIDVVILDMVMPLLDGKSTFHALRRINPDVRIILASGYSIDGEAQTLIDEGAAAFLQKPFRLATLADALATAGSSGRPATHVAS